MIIGNFIKSDTGDCYWGTIGTLHGWFKIEISPISYESKPKDDKRPDFMVDGKGVTFGCAWKRNSKKHGDYLSVRLDSPVLYAPINCALIFSENAERHQLIWHRDERKAS